MIAIEILQSNYMVSEIQYLTFNNSKCLTFEHDKSSFFLYKYYYNYKDYTLQKFIKFAAL